MTLKPLLVLPSAERDLRAAVRYYHKESDWTVARRFIDAVQVRYRSIARTPDLGSRSYADALGIEGLRSVRVPRFPYLIFYVERDDSIEVWRVLHVRRDILATLHISEEGV